MLATKEDGSSRAGLAAAVAVVLCVLCMVFAVAPALAATSHSFSFAFGEAGEGAGAMSISLVPSPTGGGIAVNLATHDVYVADIGNRRVDEFAVDAGAGSAKFVRAWGWGVATGAAELQVCTSTCKAGLSGSEPGEFESPTYVAVDNSGGASHGNVYVADTANELVTKFNGEGKLESSWGNNGPSETPNGQLKGSPAELFSAGVSGLPIDGIAVDGAGALWVVNLHERLFKFDVGGKWEATCHVPFASGAGAGGIAVNGSTIYAHDGNTRIHALSQTCTDLGVITEGAEVERVKGFAIDTSAGDVYDVRSGIFAEDTPASCQPSKLGCTPAQIFGEGLLNDGSGMAVDGGTSTVFVENSSAGTVSVFKTVLEATVEPASGLSRHEATAHATVNPEGHELLSCEFEFGPTTAYGSLTQCNETASAIGKGSSPVPVHATLTGLSVGTTYHYRLHARNPAGGVYSEDGTLTTADGPRIGEVSATEISASGITLHAVVNPDGPAAKYHFEYGACLAPGECVGAPYTASYTDGEIPAGTSDVTVSQHVAVSLTAGVTYHFRVIVNGEEGPPEPEGVFVLEPAAPECSEPRDPIDATLADCRAYELVTPPDKNEALVDNGIFLEDPSIAADGSRVLTQSLQCFNNSQSCTAIRQTEGSPFSFTRGETDWETQALLSAPTAYSTMLAYNASSDVVLLARSPEPGGLEELYGRMPDGTLHAIGPIAEAPGIQIGSIAPSPRVATSDLSHVVYESLIAALWPALEGGAQGTQIYAYPGPTPGKPALVGVSGGVGSTSLIGACGTSLGGPKAIYSTYNSLSSDGLSTFFTVQPCSTGTGENAGKAVPAYTLYDRIEGTSEARTILVSGPGPESVCNSQCREEPARDVSFQGASADGSRVFFTDTGRLTNNASADSRPRDSAFNPGCNVTTPLASGCNLYEFACPAHCEHAGERQLVDVSAGDTSGLGPLVQGVVAIPPDGSDVFFVARGVLTSAPNDTGRKPAPGANNLYVYRFSPGGGEGSVEFIASLADADRTEWTSGIVAANVTPDGRFLVFTSHNALTADVSREEGPAQVYRYDVKAKRLSRVSIGQAGFDDNGNSSGADASILTAYHGFESDIGAGQANPTMSDDGRLVFFESPTGLTPGALDDHPVTGNPNVLAENIYEWAEDGTKPSPAAAACSEPNGCVSLVSDGRDLNEGSGVHFNGSTVQLLGVDSTGENVFFSTADQLAPRDTDSQVDFYDARVGGGFSEPAEAAPCVTLGTCHAPPASPLLMFGEPASALFLGAGNPTFPSTVLPAPSAGKKSLTRAARLAVALRACKQKRSRAARARCERQARKQYGAPRSRKRRTHR